MLIVAVMNGWSASVRRRETRTARMVREFLVGGGIEFKFLARRSMLLMSRCRKFRRYILKHNSPDNELLVVGKSLGGKNLVKGVLNELPKLKYRRTALLTLDPCWPISTDLRPNLSLRGCTLKLTHPVGCVINVYIEDPDPDAQTGARLVGDPAILNWPLSSEYDHFSIVNSDAAFDALTMTVTYLLKGRT